jgi:hypothetical protein
MFRLRYERSGCRPVFRWRGPLSAAGRLGNDRRRLYTLPGDPPRPHRPSPGKPAGLGQAGLCPIRARTGLPRGRSRWSGAYTATLSGAVAPTWRVRRLGCYPPVSWGGPNAAGGRRWCGFRQPGRVQYNDPAVNTHRSWTWRHNGQTTGRPDRSRGSDVSPTPWNIPRRRAQWRTESESPAWSNGKPLTTQPTAGKRLYVK